MSKLLDMSSDQAKEVRAKKLEKAGLNCYLTEGPSRKFLNELEKYTTFLYSRLSVKIDFDLWMDAARDAALDALGSYYDPSAGAIPPFLFSRLRNIASQLNRKGKKFLTASDEVEETISTTEKSDYIVPDEVRANLIRRADAMALDISVDDILADVKEGSHTEGVKESISLWPPMAKAVAWLILKGEV